NSSESAQVVPDPLAVAGRRPAGDEVVVQRVLGNVAVIAARDDRGHGERAEGRALDGHLRNTVPQAKQRSTAPLSVAHDAHVPAGGRGAEDREVVALRLER